MPKYAKFKAHKDPAPKMGKVVSDSDKAALEVDVTAIKRSPALRARPLPGKKRKGKKAKRARKLNA